MRYRDTRSNVGSLKNATLIPKLKIGRNHDIKKETYNSLKCYNIPNLLEVTSDGTIRLEYAMLRLLLYRGNVLVI